MYRDDRCADVRKHLAFGEADKNPMCCIMRICYSKLRTSRTALRIRDPAREPARRQNQRCAATMVHALTVRPACMGPRAWKSLSREDRTMVSC